MSSAFDPEDSDSPLGEIEVFHFMPETDSVEHYESPSCICEPVLEYRDPRNGNEVWIHQRILDSLQ
jgi:hypothetical protein